MTIIPSSATPHTSEHKGTLTVITEPAVEPVTVYDARDALGLSDSEDDIRIGAYIKAARLFAENFLNRRLITQVVERSYDVWPDQVINLDVWPLQSIDSVKYDDTSSPITEQTLVENTDYYADTTTDGGRIWVIDGTWPNTADKPKPIRVRMTAGYSHSNASPADLTDGVPQKIKEGIIAYVKFLYDNDCSMDGVARALLWSDRRLY